MPFNKIFGYGQLVAIGIPKVSYCEVKFQGECYLEKIAMGDLPKESHLFDKEGVLTRRLFLRETFSPG